MTQETPRIQVSLDPSTYKLLSGLAAQESKSKSACAASLIQEALELHEDLYLSTHADARLEETREWVNHEDAWKTHE